LAAEAKSTRGAVAPSHIVSKDPTMSNTNAPRPRPDTINRLANGVYPALAMLAGMQLDVFTPLAAGPKSAAALANDLNVDAARLQPLLYALVSAGLLTLDGAAFANSDEADAYLVRGQRGYLGGQHETLSDLWSATLQTAQSIRTGIPQAKHDFASMSEDDLRAFLRGLDAGASAAARRLMKSHDMTRFQRVLDAGGGGGGLAVALCDACPDMQATVAELPNVAEIAADLLAGRDAGGRVQPLGCDLIAGPPPGNYDAAVLRSFIQVLGPTDAATVIANVGAAVEQGGEIFIVGRMLDDSRLSPLDAVAANVMFLNIYDEGQAYTEGEHRAWLEAAGFGDIEREPLNGGYSIIKGTKV
jgi:hypothetical protein